MRPGVKLQLFPNSQMILGAAPCDLQLPVSSPESREAEIVNATWQGGGKDLVEIMGGV